MRFVFPAIGDDQMFASWKENYEFAQQWSKRFADAQNDCSFLAAEYLKTQADSDMTQTGQFLQKSAQELLDIDDFEDLKRALNNCPDPWPLCVAAWLGCKELSRQKESPVGQENACQRQRMAAILKRAAFLFSQNLIPFRGTLQTMRLISRKEFTAPWEDSYQELLLSHDGQGTFRASTSDIQGSISSFRREQSISLPASAAQEILNELTEVFSGDWAAEYISDEGFWELELTDTQGKAYIFSDTLYGDDETLIRISNLLRDRLGNGELVAFDGYRQPEHTVCKITLERKADLEKSHATTGLPCEKLTLDRACGSIEWRKQTAYGDSCCRYTSVSEVGALLDLLSYPEIFRQPLPPVEEFLDVCTVPFYALRVEYSDGMSQILQGHYDKSELPGFFPDIMLRIHLLLHRLEYGCVLDPKEYKMERLRKGNLIYCSVAFEHTDKTYYYRTQDASLHKGDLVIVPAGRNNRETLAKIVNIEHFAPEDVPFPIQQTKCILRRYASEEL